VSRIRDQEVGISMARKKQRNLGELVDLLQQLPAEVFEDIRDTRPPQKREGLVPMFGNKERLDKELHRLTKKRMKAKP
jgi:hypothetical protein